VHGLSKGWGGFLQELVSQGKIGRDDVASLCVHLLESPAGTDKTFEIGSTVPFSEPWTEEQCAAAGERNWEEVLSAANLKEGVTGKTINGVYTGCNVEEEAAKKGVQGEALAASP
jgi:hypothetical protein